jgi:hypothetical protein
VRLKSQNSSEIRDWGRLGLVRISASGISAWVLDWRGRGSILPDQSTLMPLALIGTAHY